MLLDYTKHFFFIVVLAVITSSTSATTKFIEGKHYLKMPSNVANNVDVLKLKAQDENKYQVVSFFSYGCYWCWQLNKHMNQWVDKKPKDISYQRVPVTFRRGWDVLAKAYYIAEIVNRVKELDHDLFVAAHSRDRNIAHLKNLLKFYVSRGLELDDFNSMYNSFSIQQQVKFSNSIVRAYRIVETPTIVINTPNNSYVTTIDMAGGISAVTKVIDFLTSQNKNANKVSKNT